MKRFIIKRPIMPHKTIVQNEIIPTDSEEEVGNVTKNETSETVEDTKTEESVRKTTEQPKSKQSKKSSFSNTSTNK